MILNQHTWKVFIFVLSKHLKVKVKLLSRVRIFAALWTVACRAPLSVGFARPEHWSGLPLGLL